jgi:plasmid stabilization system protein ParE
MKVIWTRKAFTRLTEIEDYIAEDSPARAAEFVMELVDETDKLAKFPEAGRLVPEDDEGLRRELIHEGYRIIYRTDGGTVYILSVFEGSRLVRRDDLE